MKSSPGRGSTGDSMVMGGIMRHISIGVRSTALRVLFGRIKLIFFEQWFKFALRVEEEAESLDTTWLPTGTANELCKLARIKPIH